LTPFDRFWHGTYGHKPWWITFGADEAYTIVYDGLGKMGKGGKGSAE